VATKVVLLVVVVVVVVVVVIRTAVFTSQPIVIKLRTQLVTIHNRTVTDFKVKS